jgi:drug/metabolite transporter (DMT)-like permease
VTLATFLNSLGFIFFKLSHLRLERNPQDKTYYFMTWQFVTGFSVIVIASAINVGKSPTIYHPGYYSTNYNQPNKNPHLLTLVVSLAFADQITLSSTSSLTLVFNTILATKVLGEIFTRYDFISILLISLGASLCVFMSNYTPIPFSINVNTFSF